MTRFRSPFLVLMFLLLGFILGAWIARAQVPPGPPVSVNGDISDIPMVREGWTVVDVEDPLGDGGQVAGGDLGVIAAFPVGQRQPTGFDFDRFVMTYNLAVGQLFWGLHLTHPILYGRGVGRTTCAGDADADGDPRTNGNSTTSWWMKDDSLFPGEMVSETYRLWLRVARTQQWFTLSSVYMGMAVTNGWVVRVAGTTGAVEAQVLSRPLPDLPPLVGYTDFEMGWFNLLDSVTGLQPTDTFDFILVEAQSRDVGKVDRWSDHPGYQ